MIETADMANIAAYLKGNLSPCALVPNCGSQVNENEFLGRVTDICKLNNCRIL